MTQVSGDKFPFVDYLNLYSGILFTAYDGTPMSFVLSTRNFKQEAQLRKLIEHCGGRVERNLKSMTPHSAVLVDDDSLIWTHTGDVFKLSYIETCCTAGKCLNISPFRLNKTSTVVQEGFDYMKVIYYKKYSWETIPRKYAPVTKRNNKKTTDDADAKDVSNDDKSKKDDDKSKKDDDGDANKSSSEVTDSDEDKKPKHRKIRHNKHTRVSYTRAEKEAILKYIIDKNEFSRVRGRTMWQEMEKRGTCPNRTWQSMKEHFLKTLITQLDCFNFVTAEQKRQLKNSM